MALPLATLQSAGDTATDNGQDYIVALVGGTKVWRLNTPSVLSFLNGDGTIIGATSQAQDFTNGLTIAGGPNGINASGVIAASGLDITGAADFDSGLTINGGSNGFSSGGALTAASVGIGGITAPYATLQSVVTTTYSALFTTSDWDNAANGSGLAIYAGAASGNTSLHIQSLSSGGAATSSLIFNQYGGSVGVATTSPSAQLHTVSSNAAQPVLRLDAAAGQTASILDVRNSGGTTLASISAGGVGTLAGLTITKSVAASARVVSDTGVSRYELGYTSTGLISELAIGSATSYIGFDSSSSFAIASITGYGGAGYAEIAKFDTNATAGNTRFMIYDVDNGTLERVSVGAADSGGSGYKVLRIPN